MKQTFKRKFASLLLTLVMVIGLLPQTSVTVYAADNTVTWTESVLTSDGSVTKDGVTLNAGKIDPAEGNITDGGTFTTDLGNFTKIEVNAKDVEQLSGTGWSGSSSQKKWTGSASSVSFSNDILGMGQGFTIVFTIEKNDISVSDVTLDQNTLTMTAGTTETLKATVEPDDATDKSITWTSDNTDVASVDETGKVTAIAEGTANITVTTTDGSKTASCTLTINESQQTNITDDSTDTTESNAPSTEAVSDDNMTKSEEGKTDGDAAATNSKKKVTLKAVANDTHTHNGITFTAWDKADSLPDTEGSYYLTKDVTISATWYVPAGTTNLCLDGHQIQMTGNGSVVNIPSGRTLNLYDAEGDNGKITGGKEVQQGGAVYDAGNFVMYGGTLTENTAKSLGGGVYLNGTFTMNGGSIKNNTAPNGAGVAVERNNAKFSMTGGSIEANTASGNTGGVLLEGGGTFIMSGGSITNNKGPNFGGIGIHQTNTFKISGNVRIQDNYLTDNTISNIRQTGSGWNTKITIDGNLSSDASIGITLPYSYQLPDSVFTTGGKAAEYIDNFTSDNSDYVIVKDGNELKQVKGYTVTFNTNGGSNVAKQGVATNGLITKPTDPAKDGYRFAGWYKEEALTNAWDFETDTVTENITLYAKWNEIHIHDDIDFTPWESTNSLPATAGNYFLTKDVTISSTWNVPGTVNLCLNGYGIRKTESGRVINVPTSATLNLYDDSTTEHKYTISNPAGNGAGLATVNDDASGGNVKTFTGGYITGGNINDNGGGVYVSGTMSMYGGTIIGNHSTETGGGLFIAGGGKFYMNDGSLIGNTTKYGGGLGSAYPNSGATIIRLSGGSIIYNKSTGTGGGVHGNANSGTTSRAINLQITGDVVIANNHTDGDWRPAANTGGGIIIDGTGHIFELSGSPTIRDNTAGKSNVIDNNLYFTNRGNPKVKVGDLNPVVPIGVTMMNGTGIFTNSTDVNNNETADFTSDNSSYVVAKNDSGQLYLTAPVTVTFNSNGGSDVSQQKVIPGEKVTEPSDPTREGYAFDGWYKEEALTNAWDFDNDTVSSNTTLFAKWRQAISKTVTFKVENGSWDDNTKGEKTVTLNGYEGDTLKLTNDQIPAVGNKPDNTYMAGNWNVTPDTETGITEDTTYTYNYVKKNSITPVVSLEGWTYGETAKTPSVTGNTGNGDVTYTYAKKGSTNYSDTVPSDAGEYTVKAVIAETDQYLSAEATADFTIAKAEVTVPVITKKKYTGEKQTADVPSDSLYSVTKNEGGTDVDGYDVVLTLTDPANYKWTDSEDAAKTRTFNIVPADANEVTVSIDGWTYGENAKEPSSTADFGADTVVYTYATSEDGEYTETVPANAGTWYVKASVPSTKNYPAGEAVTSFTIAKAEVTAPSIDSKKYTGEKQIADVETSSLYTVTKNEGGTDVNGYEVVLTLTDPANYKWTDSEEAAKTLTFNIITADANKVTVSIEGWTYGENAKEPSSTADFGADTVVYTYSASEDGEYTETVPADAGTWYVKASVPATKNYPAGEAVTSFEIAKADVTITAPTEKELTYNGQEQELVNAGSSEGGELQYALGTSEEANEAYTSSIPSKKDAGTYYVWYKTVGDANHNSTDAACVEVTIDKKSLVITADAVSKIYGQADPELTYTVDGLADNDNLTGELAREEGDNAGTYAINQGTLSASDNYEVSYTGADFTINKADPDPAVISTDNMSTETETILIEGVEGQEYIIVPKGTEVTEDSWKDVILPDPERDNWVFFEELSAATEYEIYTRVSETENYKASEPVKADVNTPFDSVGLDFDSDLVGSTIKVLPEPEKEDYTYKWYWDERTYNEEGYYESNLTEIEGVTGNTYTFTDDDFGKYIVIKIFVGDSEVGDTDFGPIGYGTVNFDSKGGSDVASMTNLTYNAKITKPSDPEREGFSFAGWYQDEEYTETWDFENDTVMWTETTLYAKWEALPIVYRNTEGDNGEWTKGSKKELSFTFKRSFSDDETFIHFTGILVDGKSVDASNYTAEKGSVIINLKPSYLEKLTTGEHTLTAQFADGNDVTVKFTIKEVKKADKSSSRKTVPSTGERSSLIYEVMLISSSLLIMAILLILKKYRRA